MKDVLTPATPDGIRVGLNAPGLDKAATIADPVSLPPVGALPADLKAVVPKDGVGANDVGGPPEGGGAPPNSERNNANAPGGTAPKPGMPGSRLGLNGGSSVSVDRRFADGLLFILAIMSMPRSSLDRLYSRCVH
jgi:hypothetical protein